MSKSSFIGYLRQYGYKKTATPAVLLSCIKFTFDPTQATATVSKTLPKGAIPLFAQNMDGGATGGTDPTVDIGTLADDNGFADELDADAKTGLISTGALLGVELTADTIVYAGVGASAGTGGTVTALLYYIMSDNGDA
jgi:hypothetical protein